MRAIDPAVGAIAAAAASCESLDTLADVVRGCVACAELASLRTSVVVGDFPATARLLLVGEGPGANEDVAGRPFVGKGGQLLDSLLAEAGLDRAHVAVANVVKCRPPGNRTPTPAEARRCTGWLDRQLALCAPSLVVTLGLSALRWASGSGIRLRDVRGVVREWRGTRLLPTYHPSAALRFGPAGEPMAMLRADLRTAAAELS
ncbi:MAG: uracil-DNA glycosylase [Frankiaceae bacterium]|nr:uracil-DNA glycosylase [Frankiaceae bacterium]